MSPFDCGQRKFEEYNWKIGGRKDERKEGGRKEGRKDKVGKMKEKRMEERKNYEFIRER